MMRKTILLTLLIGTLGLSSFIKPTQVIPTAGSSPIFWVFVASSPCGGLPRKLLNLPENADCELIRWKLILHYDPTTNAPTSYYLTCTYGQYLNGTSGLIGGGTKVEFQGKWAMAKGSQNDPNAVVYQLDIAKPQMQLSFQKIDGNLLHLLDSDKRLMIGNSGESYTFNRSKDEN